MTIANPMLRCLGPEEAEIVLAEVHDGVCGNHSGGRSLAHKILSQGYYWPRMHIQAKEYTQKCRQCQLFAPSPHQPATELTTLQSPWPFMQWGLDVVGPLPPAQPQLRWLLVATDYFTKWIEAVPLSQVTAKHVVKFLWTNIVTRYGLPHTIITDNGTNFTSSEVTKFCEDYKIKHRFSTPYYPQSNGQAEISNRTIMGNLSKSLEKAKGKWVERLPGVLWAYRTTKRVPTGETPFSLAYGAEAVIPAEVFMPTLRTEEPNLEDNCSLLRISQDLSQEQKELAAVRVSAYQQQVRASHQKKIKPRQFHVGELVLRHITPGTKDSSAGKFAPPWEGPYTIIGVGGRGSYTLANEDNEVLPKQWNISHLKKYYV